MTSENDAEEAVAGQDADAPPQDEARGDVESFFFFRLGDDLFAFPGHEVLAVDELQRPVRVPTAVDPFLGVVHVRGRVLAVIDLRGLLGLPARAASEAGTDLSGRLVVLIVDERPVAFRADTVLGLRDAEKDTLRPVPRPPDAPADQADPIVVGQLDDINGVTTVLSGSALFASLLRARQATGG